MAKIIRKGWTHAVACRECGSLVEFDAFDVRYTLCAPGTSQYFAECPVCKNSYWFEDNVLPQAVSNRACSNEYEKEV
jgi:hypothetical protein